MTACLSGILAKQIETKQQLEEVEMEWLECHSELEKLVNRAENKI